SKLRISWLSSIHETVSDGSPIVASDNSLNFLFCEPFMVHQTGRVPFKLWLSCKYSGLHEENLLAYRAITFCFLVTSWEFVSMMAYWHIANHPNIHVRAAGVEKNFFSTL